MGAGEKIKSALGGAGDLFYRAYTAKARANMDQRIRAMQAQAELEDELMRRSMSPGETTGVAPGWRYQAGEREFERNKKLGELGVQQAIRIGQASKWTPPPQPQQLPPEIPYEQTQDYGKVATNVRDAFYAASQAKLKAASESWFGAEGATRKAVAEVQADLNEGIRAVNRRQDLLPDQKRELIENLQADAADLIAQYPSAELATPAGPSVPEQSAWNRSRPLGDLVPRIPPRQPSLGSYRQR